MSPRTFYNSNSGGHLPAGFYPAITSFVITTKDGCYIFQEYSVYLNNVMAEKVKPLFYLATEVETLMITVTWSIQVMDLI